MQPARQPPERCAKSRDSWKNKAQSLIVFSKSQNFEPISRFISEALVAESKAFAHFRGGWLANCVTRGCLRIAFNYMNKNRVPQRQSGRRGCEATILANLGSYLSH